MVLFSSFGSSGVAQYRACLQKFLVGLWCGLCFLCSVVHARIDCGGAQRNQEEALEPNHSRVLKHPAFLYELLNIKHY